MNRGIQYIMIISLMSACQSNRNPKAENENDAGTESDADTDSDSNSDTETNTETESDSETEVDCADLESGQLCWVRAAGGANQDYPTEIETHDDSAIVTGNCGGGPNIFGEGQENETTLTGIGICTARYGIDGKLLWAVDTLISGYSNVTSAYGIAKYLHGAMAITGRFDTEITFGLGEPNETTLHASGPEEVDDIFLVSYDMEGSTQWAKRAGGQYCDVGLGAARLSNGSIAIAGGFSGIAVFGEGEENETAIETSVPIDDQAPYLGKYKEDGTLNWVRPEPIGVTRIRDLVAGGDDSIYLTGNYWEEPVFGMGGVNEEVLSEADYYDVFTVRYDEDGTLMWVSEASGPEKDAGFAIAVAEDGSVAVAGTFDEELIMAQGEPEEITLVGDTTSSEIFIAKYSSYGTIQSATKTIGATGGAATGVTILDDGSVIVTGFIRGTTIFGEGEPNETILEKYGWQTVFLARYSTGLTLDWCVRVVNQEEISVSNNWRMSRVKVFNDGTIVLASRFSGENIVFGEGEPNETLLSSNGSTDIFVARYVQ